MTGFRASDYLLPIARAIPESLITRANLDAMLDIARHIPGAMTGFFGFECRLGETDAPADILFAVNHQELGVLAGTRPGLDLPDAFWQVPVWNQARAFCAETQNTASPLYEKADNLWLEFDLDTSARDVPVFSAFFGSYKITAAQNGDTAQHLTWFTDYALPLLYGQGLSPKMQTRVLECIQALPPHALVFQTGAMLSRTPPFVRLCIGGISPNQLPNYLDTIAWRGNYAQLQDWLTQLSALVDTITLDIDVGVTVGELVGLECYFNQQRAPAHEPRWFPFLDFLESKNVLTHAKRAGLCAYSGFVHERSDAARNQWPPALLTASQLLGPNYFSSLLWGPHHIKIVLKNSDAQAKAYLYVEHQWLKLSDLKTSPQVPANQMRRL